MKTEEETKLKKMEGLSYFPKILSGKSLSERIKKAEPLMTLPFFITV